jgi:hypothetical protein
LILKLDKRVQYSYHLILKLDKLVQYIYNLILKLDKLVQYSCHFRPKLYQDLNISLLLVQSH